MKAKFSNKQRVLEGKQLLGKCFASRTGRDAILYLSIFALGYLLAHTLSVNDQCNNMNANTMLRSDNDKVGNTKSVSNNDKLSSTGVWEVLPFEHTDPVEIIPGVTTDAFNPIYNYILQLKQEGGAVTMADFPNLPLFHTWVHFPEAYHNHFHRFRGKEKVVFMEVGVQSGGKIALLRDYIGPGLIYVGIDVNPSTKMFESADWVHIEIGDSANRKFLSDIKQKYPVVDIFLDDGGHTMNQQKVAIEEMLLHVQPEGVFICEDLSTSWGTDFQGIPNQDVRSEDFREKTMFGLVHKTLDWLNSGWIHGRVMKYDNDKLPEGFFAETWWRKVADQVKHIHMYNQIVVYEKGRTYTPDHVKTVGKSIPYQASGVHEPADWDQIMKKIQQYTKSTWNWG